MGHDHEDRKLIHTIEKLIKRIGDLISCCIHAKCPHDDRRFTRLEVVAIRFKSQKQFGKFITIMPDPNPSSISIDIPAASGPCVQFTVAPLDKNNKPQLIEAGTLKATVSPDASAAQVAISPDERYVDILLPDVADALATVELDADPNLTPGDQGEVITTVITLRRLGAPVDEAVTLGIDPAAAVFKDASQFGVFPTPAPLTAKKK